MIKEASNHFVILLALGFVLHRCNAKKFLYIRMITVVHTYQQYVHAVV